VRAVQEKLRQALYAECKVTLPLPSDVATGDDPRPGSHRADGGP